MPTLTSDYLIQAPPERVYAALCDPDAFGQWMPNFGGVERLTPGPFGVGTRFRETRKMFGTTGHEVFEVTEAEPGRRLGLYVDGKLGSTGKGEYRFTYDFSPEGPATRVRMQGDIQMPGGWLTRLFGKLMLPMMKKALDKDMLAFKAHVEKQG